MKSYIQSAHCLFGIIYIFIDFVMLTVQFRYVASNGLERRGEWRDGKRVRWLDGDAAEAVPN